MDNNKEFFEKLAGISSDDMTSDFEPQLVKAETKAPLIEETDTKGKEDLLKISGEDFDFDNAEGHLTIDVYQNDENIVIESTIAGVNVDDLDIAITPESVTIKGKREKKERVKKDDYLYQECFWGKFSRSIILPQEIDPDKSQASLKDGILKVVLPKVHKTRSKKVRVKLD
jgi:HSP20 family protein